MNTVPVPRLRRAFGRQVSARRHVGACSANLLELSIVSLALAAAPLFAQQPPAPWQSLDIGAVGATGTTNCHAGTFTIEGAGDDVWNSLTEDGGYAVKNGNYSEAAGEWFDEFDRAGAGGSSWLGVPVDGHQRTPYQNGVYFRRFRNGAALVNPRSNPGSGNNDRPTVDVTIPTNLGLYQRISGVQDPGVNNGQNLPLNGSGVPHISIMAGDGILLMNQ